MVGQVSKALAGYRTYIFNTVMFVVMLVAVHYIGQEPTDAEVDQVKTGLNLVIDGVAFLWMAGVNYWRRQGADKQTP